MDAPSPDNNRNLSAEFSGMICWTACARERSVTYGMRFEEPDKNSVTAITLIGAVNCNYLECLVGDVGIEPTTSAV